MGTVGERVAGTAVSRTWVAVPSRAVELSIVLSIALKLSNEGSWDGVVSTSVVFRCEFRVF